MSLAIAKKESPDNTHKPKRDRGYNALKNVHTINHNPHDPIIQRKPLCPCDGGCPRCVGIIQPKLIIGQPNDTYEQEADRIAEQVMRMPEKDSVSASVSVGEGNNSAIQRKPVNRTTSGQHILAREALQATGSPLDLEIRGFMEDRFGDDFGQVSLHTDSRAIESAQSLAARAYTIGSHIVFGRGQYAPRTTMGRKLIAHELAHVLQQRGDAWSITGTTHFLFPQDFSLEREAEETATRITHGMSACKISQHSGLALQRDVDPQYRRYLSVVSEERLRREYRRLDRLINELPVGSLEFTDTIEQQQAVLDELESRGSPMSVLGREPAAEAGFERRSVSPPEREPEASPAPHAETPTEARVVPTGWRRWLNEVGEGLEAVGDVMSARWFWTPIMRQMAEWERDLDAIGEIEGRSIEVSGTEAVLIPIGIVFSLVHGLLGTADLLARLNPANVALQNLSRQARAVSGTYTPDQLERDLSDVGREAWGLQTLGLGQAVDHMREGIREANAFRTTQAVTEIVLAILAVIGAVAGVRSLSSRARMQAAVEAEAGGITQPPTGSEAGLVDIPSIQEGGPGRRVTSEPSALSSESSPRAQARSAPRSEVQPSAEELMSQWREEGVIAPESAPRTQGPSASVTERAVRVEESGRAQEIIVLEESAVVPEVTARVQGRPTLRSSRTAPAQETPLLDQMLREQEFFNELLARHEAHVQETVAQLMDELPVTEQRPIRGGALYREPRSAIRRIGRARREIEGTFATSETEIAPGVTRRTGTFSRSRRPRASVIRATPERVARHVEEMQRAGIDYRLPHHGRDRVGQGGFPGRYYAIHAEKQMIVARPNQPVNVSRPMCDDCIAFFRAEARFRGRRQVVSDPQATRVFDPDGSVTEHWPDGTIVRFGPDGRVSTGRAR